MLPASLSLVHLSKTFSGKLAVDDLSLELAPGSLFAFLGPNGAGKTTTVKLLAGLLQPTQGAITVCGHDLKQDPLAARACLSYIPDQPYLYDKLTGREFLQFVGRLRRVERVEDRIKEFVDRLELSGFIDDLTENYSHGMKQRLVFASALLPDPPVLLVDEPMVGLDPKSARTVKNLLRERVARGKVIFMSTHSLPTAEEIATEIGIIHEGRLLTRSAPGELTQGRESLETVFLRLTEEEAEAPARPRA